MYVNLSDQINIEGFRNLNPQEETNIVNAAFLAPLDEYKLLEPLDHLPLGRWSRRTCTKALAKLNSNEASWARQHTELDL